MTMTAKSLYANRTLLGCNCSDYQMEQVGCDCVEIIIECWPHGYAHADGLSRLNVSHAMSEADLHAAVRKAFGLGATIYTRRERFPIPRRVETFSDEYVRDMSFKDNS